MSMSLNLDEKQRVERLAEVDVAVESVVRLVLSAITRPSKPPAEAAADIGWILRLALRGARG